MGLVQDLLQKQAKLESDRSNFEQHWSEIAPLVLNRQDDFFNETHAPGERRTRKKFDDTATLALERGSAAIEGILIPRGQKWHGIELPEEIRGDYEAEVWANDLRDFLFRMRYSPKANFASQAHEFIMSLLAFGTAVMAVEDIVGHGIRYKALHLSEHFIMENAKGVIDTNYRKYKITARQAQEKFGDKTPEKVRDKAEKDPNHRMEFLHVVMPNNGDAPEDMDFVSYHISIEDNELITTGGYRTFPYIISRWVTAPNETYGRSPAMNVLAEIKMLNTMRRTDIKARHNAVSPPILAADQHTIRRLSLKPEAINFGTLDMNGRELVKPYNSGSRIDVSNDTLEQSRQVINSAFFLDLFQILIDSPQMTATEVLTRAQEKGTLLSPSAGRQKNEFLDPLIEREISLYESYGIFEDDGILPMPDSLKELGGTIEVKYQNPITHMQNSEEALATERTVQALIPIAQIDPSVLDPVDWSEYANIVRSANGAPQRLFKDPDVLEEEKAAKEQVEQTAMLAQVAPQVTGSIKDLAQADALQRS